MLKVKNYKCFGEEYQGFEELKPFSLIIGKNNSGKSALIDLVEYATSPSPRVGQGHKGMHPDFIFAKHLSEEVITTIFDQRRRTSAHPFQTDLQYGMTLKDKVVTLRLADNAQVEYLDVLNPHFFDQLSAGDDRTRWSNAIAEKLTNPMRGKRLFRLSAERNIIKEPRQVVTRNSLWFDVGGNGATNLIRSVINNKEIPDSYVNTDLIQALNEIYGEDGHFNRLIPQETEADGLWEIYLEQSKKGNLIPLSSSGSSLKTVILVLLNLLVVPRILNVDLKNCIFAIEEPENNLHPSLQRRLITYIKNFQIENESMFLISTHSNVFIDIFANDEDAQILHVRHNGESATVGVIKTYSEKADLIDDLDFRASDVLQSNGVIWVEGPSDRIYLKKWIEILTEGTIQEDLHYQFVMYGGSLLKHLNSEDPELQSSALSILRINKHAVVVMDSDKSKQADPLSPAKQAVIDSFSQKSNCYAFVTEGRDIENYLSSFVIQNHHGLDVEPRHVSQFTKFEDYLDKNVSEGEGNRFNRSKTLYAQYYADLMTDENTAWGLSCKSDIEKIVDLIKSWNKLT